MEIADSAHKHGVADQDIRHALRLPRATVWQTPDRLLVIGADRAGRLLEVVILDLDSEDDDPIVIHAMLLRPKFHRYL